MTDLQKRSLLKFAAISAVAAAALVGCGKKEAPPPAPVAAPAKADPLKIAFAYVGPVGDGGWTFAHDNGRKAAVLHDSRYCIKQGSRKDADDLFLEALERCGVGFLRRWAMYAGVRAGGWVYWDSRSGITEADFLD